MRLGKNQRQHRIAQILRRESVSSQDHLVELLAAEGVVATQATVSRDLDDLGALKVPTGGGSVYAIPELPTEQIAPDDHLRRVLGEWVVAVGCSGNLVVLNTPPGSAHVVGSAIDRTSVPEVLGTVAGDDTVLVVATEQAGGGPLAEFFRAQAGLATPTPPDPEAATTEPNATTEAATTEPNATTEAATKEMEKSP